VDPLAHQQGVNALFYRDLCPDQRAAIPTQLTQVANGLRRDVDGHHAVAPQGFGEAPRIQPVGFRRIAGLQRRFSRIHDYDGEHLSGDLIDETPRWPRGFDDHATTPRTASHDLRVVRFYAGRPEGIMKTFPLRGIKDTPPYLHDGRCPTLEDSVGFNLVLGTNLTGDEKDLVAYLRGL
jgi:hypothetical protein